LNFRVDLQYNIPEPLILFWLTTAVALRDAAHRQTPNFPRRLPLGAAGGSNLAF
jgi:hypothetical protein